MSVTTRLVTAHELLRMPDDGFCYELINGELIKMPPPGSEHGFVCINAGALLRHHVRAKRLGVILGNDAGFQLTSNPDTVLGADVSFVRRSRVPAEGLPKGYWPGAPDLAVEVLSQWDTLKEAKEKAQSWLAAGALMVWIVNPGKRSVIVCRPGTSPVTVAEGDTLEGENVVAGFRCRVADLFA